MNEYRVTLRIEYEDGVKIEHYCIKADNAIRATSMATNKALSENNGVTEIRRMFTEEIYL